jgi:hypothetical protein
VWGLTDRFLDSWWSFLSIPSDPLSPLAGLAGCGGFALQSGRCSLFIGDLGLEGLFLWRDFFAYSFGRSGLLVYPRHLHSS